MKKLTPGQLAYADVATSALSGIASIASAIRSSKVAKASARIYDAAAKDALTRGETSIDRSNRQYAQAKGSARASMAARGVALDEGSPADVLDSYDLAKREDAQVIAENAVRESDAYRMQAWGLRAQAQADRTNAFGSLLDGVTTVSSKWYGYKQRGITPSWRG